jgi:hypothetical protein
MGRLLGATMVFMIHVVCVMQAGDSVSSLPFFLLLYSHLHPHLPFLSLLYLLPHPAVREDMKLPQPRNFPSEIAKELQVVNHEHCPPMCAKFCLFRKSERDTDLVSNPVYTYAINYGFR